MARSNSRRRRLDYGDALLAPNRPAAMVSIRIFRVAQLVHCEAEAAPRSSATIWRPANLLRFAIR